MTECATKQCDGTPIYRIFWPGKDPLLMCTKCRGRALFISQAMGFYLHTEPIVEEAVSQD